MKHSIIRIAVTITAVSVLLSQSASAAITQSSICEPVETGGPPEISSTTISLRVANPNGPVKDVIATFDILTAIEPVNLEANMDWQPSTRMLTVPLGDFAAGEEKQFVLNFTGMPAACIIYGELQGVFSPAPAVGAAEWQQEVNFSLILPATPATPGPSGQTTTTTDKETLIDRFSSTLKKLRDNETIKETVPAVAIGAGLVGAAIPGVAAVAGVPWWNLLEFLHFASAGAVRKKKQQPWGVVFDKETRRPISGATIRVFDTETNRLRGAEPTDGQGRFGLIVPPGSYKLRVSKKSYGQYESEPVTVTETPASLNLQVALQPEGMVMASSGWDIFWKRLQVVLDVINPYVLIAGTILSLVIATLYPSPLHYGVLAFYFVLDGIKIILMSLALKPFGQVLDKFTKQLLPLAVVRIFEAKRNWLMVTKTTDEQGRFKFLVAPGEYYVTCAKEGYKTFATTPTTIVQDELINWDINLVPEKR